MTYQGMPLKDPTQRKQYNRDYGREYARTRSSKKEGVCSVPTCNNKVGTVTSPSGTSASAPIKGRLEVR